jgi:BolA protein
MKIQTDIEAKLTADFQPLEMVVVNESHMHSVPANSETHFKVVLVSAAFDGKRKVARHQQVYSCLKVELAGCVHALALHTYTQEEWQEMQDKVPDSPNCLGGSKTA